MEEVLLNIALVVSYLIFKVLQLVWVIGVIYCTYVVMTGQFLLAGVLLVILSVTAYAYDTFY